ncbi:hypothetical protein VOLCADRAFT_96188 [Volvox carteri f. nagariensis]|uniref:PPM-type phosphatase domain-containing protein n=1 Tax=Volvox carteri f. nagariensis TaxID=3068 RepID=D8U9G1_VOLCA|nr:uncharacterized protein VOLCADRAFT_96188 [Volvox carteri f. nagariensis]EFJ43633.1 hypothetical protein VOLCADRAFT_96188 [Volvox carteri f. nagariensis]|eukprot:XP_002955333.1 hypothetical protein VOLCADRAFT_96188 [Volvox carteri f. nagariensis]
MSLSAASSRALMRSMLKSCRDRRDNLVDAILQLSYKPPPGELEVNPTLHNLPERDCANQHSTQQSAFAILVTELLRLTDDDDDDYDDQNGEIRPCRGGHASIGIGHVADAAADDNNGGFCGKEDDDNEAEPVGGGKANDSNPAGGPSFVIANLAQLVSEELEAAVASRLPEVLELLAQAVSERLYPLDSGLACSWALQKVWRGGPMFPAGAAFRCTPHLVAVLGLPLMVRTVEEQLLKLLSCADQRLGSDGSWVELAHDSRGSAGSAGMGAVAPGEGLFPVSAMLAAVAALGVEGEEEVWDMLGRVVVMALNGAGGPTEDQCGVTGGVERAQMVQQQQRILAGSRRAVAALAVAEGVVLAISASGSQALVAAATAPPTADPATAAACGRLEDLLRPLLFPDAANPAAQRRFDGAVRAVEMHVKRATSYQALCAYEHVLRTTTATAAAAASGGPAGGKSSTAQLQHHQHQEHQRQLVLGLVRSRMQHIAHGLAGYAGGSGGPGAALGGLKGLAAPVGDPAFAKECLKNFALQGNDHLSKMSGLYRTKWIKDVKPVLLRLTLDEAAARKRYRYLKARPVAGAPAGVYTSRGGDGFFGDTLHMDRTRERDACECFRLITASELEAWEKLHEQFGMELEEPRAAAAPTRGHERSGGGSGDGGGEGTETVLRSPFEGLLRRLASVGPSLNSATLDAVMGALAAALAEELSPQPQPLLHPQSIAAAIADVGSSPSMEQQQQQQQQREERQKEKVAALEVAAHVAELVLEAFVAAEELELAAAAPPVDAVEMGPAATVAASRPALRRRQSHLAWQRRLLDVVVHWPELHVALGRRLLQLATDPALCSSLDEAQVLGLAAVLAAMSCVTVNQDATAAAAAVTSAAAAGGQHRWPIPAALYTWQLPRGLVGGRARQKMEGQGRRRQPQAVAAAAAVLTDDLETEGVQSVGGPALAQAVLGSLPLGPSAQQLRFTATFLGSYLRQCSLLGSWVLYNTDDNIQTGGGNDGDDDGGGRNGRVDISARCGTASRPPAAGSTAWPAPYPVWVSPPVDVGERRRRQQPPAAGCVPAVALRCLVWIQKYDEVFVENDGGDGGEERSGTRVDDDRSCWADVRRVCGAFSSSGLGKAMLEALAASCSGSGTSKSNSSSGRGKRIGLMQGCAAPSGGAEAMWDEVAMLRLTVRALEQGLQLPSKLMEEEATLLLRHMAPMASRRRPRTESVCGSPAVALRLEDDEGGQEGVGYGLVQGRTVQTIPTAPAPSVQPAGSGLLPALAGGLLALTGVATLLGGVWKAKTATASGVPAAADTESNGRATAAEGAVSLAQGDAPVQAVRDTTVPGVAQHVPATQQGGQRPADGLAMANESEEVSELLRQQRQLELEQERARKVTSALQEELQNRERELLEAQREGSAQVAGARVELKESRRKAELLEAMVGALRERLRREEDRNAALEEEIELGREEMARFAGQRQELQERIEALRLELADTQAKLLVAQALAADLDVRVAQLRAQNTELELRVGELEAQLQSRTAAVAVAAASAEEKLRLMQAATDEDRLYIAKLQGKLAERESQLAVLREGESELQEVLEQSKAAAAQMAELLRQRDAELQRLQEALLEAEKRRLDQEKALNTQIAALESEREPELQRLQAAVKEAEARRLEEAGGMKKQLDNLRRLHEHQVQQLRDASEAAEQSAQAEIAALKEKLSGLQSERDKEVTLLNSQLQESARHAERLQDMAKAQAAAHEEEVQALRKQVEDAKLRAEQASARRVSEVSELRSALEQQLGSARQEALDARFQLAAVKEQLDGVLSDEWMALLEDELRQSILPGTDNTQPALKPSAVQGSPETVQLESLALELSELQSGAVARLGAAMVVRAQQLEAAAARCRKALQAREVVGDQQGIQRLTQQLSSLTSELAALYRSVMVPEARNRERAVRQELQAREMELRGVVEQQIRLQDCQEQEQRESMRLKEKAIAAASGPTQQQLRKVVQSRVKELLTERERQVQQQAAAREQQLQAQLRAAKAGSDVQQRELKAVQEAVEKQARLIEESWKVQLEASSRALKEAAADKQRLAAEVSRSSEQVRQQLAELETLRRELLAARSAVAALRRAAEDSRASAAQQSVGAAAEVQRLAAQVQQLQDALKERERQYATSSQGAVPPPQKVGGHGTRSVRPATPLTMPSGAAAVVTSLSAAVQPPSLLPARRPARLFLSFKMPPRPPGPQRCKGLQPLPLLCSQDERQPRKAVIVVPADPPTASSPAQAANHPPDSLSPSNPAPAVSSVVRGAQDAGPAQQLANLATEAAAPGHAISGQQSDAPLAENGSVGELGGVAEGRQRQLSSPGTGLGSSGGAAVNEPWSGGQPNVSVVQEGSNVIGDTVATVVAVAAAQATTPPPKSSETGPPLRRSISSNVPPSASSSPPLVASGGVSINPMIGPASSGRPSGPATPSPSPVKPLTPLKVPTPADFGDFLRTSPAAPASASSSAAGAAEAARRAAAASAAGTPPTPKATGYGTPPITEWGRPKSAPEAADDANTSPSARTAAGSAGVSGASNITSSTTPFFSEAELGAEIAAIAQSLVQRTIGGGARSASSALSSLAPPPSPAAAAKAPTRGSAVTRRGGGGQPSAPSLTGPGAAAGVSAAGGINAGVAGTSSGTAAGVARRVQLSVAAYGVPHVAKADKGSEDAYFMATPSGGVVSSAAPGGRPNTTSRSPLAVAISALGVADGVGGWAEANVDPGQYSREIMDAAARAAEESGPGADPRQLLARAQDEVRTIGSCTACVAVLSNKAPQDKGPATSPSASSSGGSSCNSSGGGGEQVLSIANLGDSGCRVVRRGSLVLATSAQEHQFNMPYQMAHPDNLPDTDTAEDAQMYQLALEPGDVVILATDGLFDNMWDEELVSLAAAAAAAVPPGLAGPAASAAAQSAAQQLATSLVIGTGVYIRARFVCFKLRLRQGLQSSKPLWLSEPQSDDVSDDRPPAHLAADSAVQFGGAPRPPAHAHQT